MQRQEVRVHKWLNKHGDHNAAFAKLQRTVPQEFGLDPGLATVSAALHGFRLKV